MTGTWKKPTFGVVVLVGMLAGLAWALRPSAPVPVAGPSAVPPSTTEGFDSAPVTVAPALSVSVDPQRIVAPPPAKPAIGKCPDGQTPLAEPGRSGCARLVDGGLLPEGAWTFVDTNGAATNGQFVDGRREGKWTTWSPSGKAILSETYVRDVLDGLQIEWTEGGQRIAERPYKAGALDGTVVLHRPNGETVVEVWKGGRRVDVPDGG